MVEKLINFINILEEDSQINDVKKHGYCRNWTKRAAQLAHDFFEPNEWEILAREISLGTTDHTFLRVRNLKDEQLSFFYDGTGTFKSEPYFGPESESPDHFKNNQKDPYSDCF